MMVNVLNRLLAAVIGSALLLTSAYGQSVQVTLVDAEGQPLENAVVELLIPESQRNGYQQQTNSLIDQRDKEFVPAISVVTAGSQVNFPNSDDILHHVYSFSSAKTFNIPLYGQGENDDYFETFTESGIVEIGCNIHDWMLAYLYIAETKLVSLSDAAGIAVIENAPTGAYSIRIWHPRAAASEEELTLPVVVEGGSVTELSMSLELRRDRRVRRAPGSDGRRYR